MHFLSLQMESYIFSNGMNFIVKKHLFVLQIMLIHKLIRRCMESKDPNKENNLFVAWNLHFNTLEAAILPI